MVRTMALGCGGFVALAATAFLVLVLVQPSSFRIARSVTMARPIETVRAAVLDVERLERVMYTGQGRGSYLVVLSPDHSGVGAYLERVRGAEYTRYTIAAIDDGGVTYDVDVGAGANTTLRFELGAVDPVRTAVTVSVSGPIETFLQRVLWPFVNLEGRLGPDLVETLRALDEESRR